MKKEVLKIVSIFKEGLTTDGRMKVFEQNQKLSSEQIIKKADPEAYTTERLVSPIIDLMGVQRLPQKHFRGIKEDLRKVDYVYTNQENKAFLAEIKPVNSDLFSKSINSAVNQIKGLFRLAEVKEQYEFGIATDGLKWVFIDKYANIAFQLDIRENFDQIRNILVGEEEVEAEKYELEISQKFWVIAANFGNE